LIFENDLYNMGVLGLGVYKLEPRGWDSSFVTTCRGKGWELLILRWFRMAIVWNSKCNVICMRTLHFPPTFWATKVETESFLVREYIALLGV